MRVCLIIPPSPFLLDDRVFPSLGVLRVAATLEARGHDVDVLDLSGPGDVTGQLVNYMSSHGTYTYGITATTPQMPSVMKIVADLKFRHPFPYEMKIILGGPHGTMTYAAGRGKSVRAYTAIRTLEKTFTTIVTGDGEYAIHEAIKDGAPKWIDADDRKSRLFMTTADVVQPARHMIDMESYKYQIDGKKSTSIISQLGCPFSCKFCGGRSSPSLRFIRKRSVASVVKEVRHLYETYGYTGFMFYDDELNVNKELLQLMNALSLLQSQLNVEFSFRGFVKAELFNEEQAEAMYRAGFRWLLCGFEAADERILTNIAKRATVDDNTRMLETAQEAGIKVKALMSIGHPGETPETIDAIRRWLVAREVDDFDCTIITPYPGTPYHDEAVPHDDGVWCYTAESGDRQYQLEIDYAVTADYYKGIPGEYRSHVFTDALEPEELVSLRDGLEKDVRKKLKLPFAYKPLERTMGQ